MPDFLDEKRREIGARLKELKPLVDEYTRLQAAAAALDSVATAAPAPAARSRQSRPATTAKAGPRRRAGPKGKPRGRPKGSGTRAGEALKLIKAHPGITIPELAEKMGIKQNYLYRVLPGLVEDGLVKKDGRGWLPQASA